MAEHLQQSEMETERVSCLRRHSRSLAIRRLHNVIDLFLLAADQLCQQPCERSPLLHLSQTHINDLQYQTTDRNIDWKLPFIRCQFQSISLSESIMRKPWQVRLCTAHMNHSGQKGQDFQPSCRFITGWWSRLGPLSGESCLAWLSILDLRRSTMPYVKLFQILKIQSELLFLSHFSLSWGVDKQKY